jgi:hypothetical protein
MTPNANGRASADSAHLRNDNQRTLLKLDHVLGFTTGGPGFKSRHPDCLTGVSPGHGRFRRPRGTRNHAQVPKLPRDWGRPSGRRPTGRPVVGGRGRRRVAWPQAVSWTGPRRRWRASERRRRRWSMAIETPTNGWQPCISLNPISKARPTLRGGPDGIVPPAQNRGPLGPAHLRLTALASISRTSPANGRGLVVVTGEDDGAAALAVGPMSSARAGIADDRRLTPRPNWRHRPNQPSAVSFDHPRTMPPTQPDGIVPRHSLTVPNPAGTPRPNWRHRPNQPSAVSFDHPRTMPPTPESDRTNPVMIRGKTDFPPPAPNGRSADPRFVTMRPAAVHAQD